MKEDWKDIRPGYMVSDLGNMYSKVTGKYMRPYSARGYLQVDLKGKKHFVGHLVWEAFKGEKPRRLFYLDGNPKNCALENLLRLDRCLGDFNTISDR